MLNLRDPKINERQTEASNTYGSRTEPLSLTAVVMNDVSTFQGGAEAQGTGMPHYNLCDGSKVDSFVFQVRSALRLCRGDENHCID